MSELYSIKKETLTDIGDALRRRHGETEWVINNEEGAVSFVSKSPGTTGFNQYGGQFKTGWTIDVYEIPSATTIKAKVGSLFYTGNQKIIVVEGAVKNYTDVQFKPSVSDNNIVELVFNTDTISIAYEDGFKYEGNYGYYAEFYAYDAEGNLLQQIKNTYKSSEMAQAIDDLQQPLPEEALIISGDCSYRFANGGWDWFINLYGDRITTKDMISPLHMFDGSNVSEIPFDLNFSTNTQIRLTYLFSSCKMLSEIPRINKIKILDTDNMFQSCQNLRNIPEDIADWFDWSYMDNLTSTSQGGNRNTSFQSCYSLRSFPMEFLAHGNPKSRYNYSIYYQCFQSCYVLDEVVNLPFPHNNISWTSNSFSSTFNVCYRLKNITFALQEDGSPYTVDWKSQTIDLTSSVGFCSRNSEILNYNSGITADKEVKDDTTYQALKNDPDWFTAKVEYSRYNKDSAIATINSLPDTSAYLATAGGTNTIKFKGNAGSLTDGGAINTMGEEIIASAAAKGWTVAFV